MAMVGASLTWLLACKSKPSVPSKPLNKVEAAMKTLVDLNATQDQVMRDLIEKRNQLLSMPKDSPPTREITRQLAILNKQATDVATEIFRGEMGISRPLVPLSVASCVRVATIHGFHCPPLYILIGSTGFPLAGFSQRRKPSRKTGAGSNRQRDDRDIGRIEGVRRERLGR